MCNSIVPQIWHLVLKEIFATSLFCWDAPGLSDIQNKIEQQKKQEKIKENKYKMQKNHYFQNPPASDQYSLWEVPSDGDPGQRLQLDRFEGNLGRFFAANFVRAAFDNLLRINNFSLSMTTG